MKKRFIKFKICWISFMIIFLHFTKINFHFTISDYFITLCICIITIYDLKKEYYHILDMYSFLIPFIFLPAEKIYIIKPITVFGLGLLAFLIVKVYEK